MYHYAVISPCCSKLVVIFVILFLKIPFPQCSFKYKSPYSILGPIRFKAWLRNTRKKYRPEPFFDFFRYVTLQVCHA